MNISVLPWEKVTDLGALDLGHPAFGARLLRAGVQRVRVGAARAGGLWAALDRAKLRGAMHQRGGGQAHRSRPPIPRGLHSPFLQRVAYTAVTT